MRISRAFPWLTVGAKDLSGGVLLLRRSVGIGLQDGIDEWFERIYHRGECATLIRFGLGLAEDLPDLAAGVKRRASSRMPRRLGE